MLRYSSNVNQIASAYAWVLNSKRFQLFVVFLIDYPEHVWTRAFHSMIQRKKKKTRRQIECFNNCKRSILFTAMSSIQPKSSEYVYTIELTKKNALTFHLFVRWNIISWKPKPHTHTLWLLTFAIHSNSKIVRFCCVPRMETSVYDLMHCIQINLLSRNWMLKPFETLKIYIRYLFGCLKPYCSLFSDCLGRLPLNFELCWLHRVRSVSRFPRIFYVFSLQTVCVCGVRK